MNVANNNMCRGNAYPPVAESVRMCMYTASGSLVCTGQNGVSQILNNAVTGRDAANKQERFSTVATGGTVIEKFSDCAACSMGGN